MTTKTYSELILFPTFEERFNYLKMNGNIGEMTFNGHRYLNQILYTSGEWKNIRRKVIIRDNGFDLAMDGYEIRGPIIIHHINPITIDDIIERKSCVFDLENLISTSHDTHNGIHYGDDNFISSKKIIVRTQNDTCLWR